MTVYIKVDNELYHHGILGQKWGTRNGPPYPLDSGSHSAREKKADWRKSMDSREGSASTKKALASRGDTVKAAPKKPAPVKKTTQAPPKENTSPKKAPAQEPEETKPKRQPMTEEQKRKVRNIALATAAVAGVSAAVYFGYKYHAVEKIKNAGNDPEKAKKVMIESLDDYTDVIRSGSTFHQITEGAAKGVSRVSFDKKDIAKRMVDLTGSGKDVRFTATKDIKIPTEAKARQIFEELWESDPTYKNELRDLLTEQWSRRQPGQSKEMIRMSVEKNLRKDAFYEAIFGLQSGGPGEASSKLVNKIKEAGYDAVRDTRGKSYEGLNQPLFIFDQDGALTKSGEAFVSKSMAIKATASALTEQFKERWDKAGTENLKAVLQRLLAG